MEHLLSLIFCYFRQIHYEYDDYECYEWEFRSRLGWGGRVFNHKFRHFDQKYPGCYCCVTFRFLQTPTNVFVAGLACLDVGMGIITLVLIVESIEPSWVNKRLPCLAKVAFAGVNVFSSAMMLTGTVNHLLGSNDNALCVYLSLKVSINAYMRHQGR